MAAADLLIFLTHHIRISNDTKACFVTLRKLRCSEVRGRMRCRILISLTLLLIAPAYAAAQGPSLQTLAGSLPFQRSEPRKVAPFPLVLNAAVQSYVDSYLAHSEGLKLSYARSAPYIAQMTQMLGEYGVPADMVYLAFAESSFTKGGAGPWQLTKATARRFGLIVNQFLDERRDPLKSTRAAA